MMKPRKKKNLRGINLNLIPVLSELLQCRNVTHAARRVNLTQSAVSSSLKRLREIFDDDLLVMHGRDMVLTEKAQKLLPALQNVLESVHNLMGDKEFDPATSERQFRIMTADYVSAMLITDLAPVLAEAAPKISLSVTTAIGATVSDMQIGFVDLLIAPEKMNSWEAFKLGLPDSEFQYEVYLKDHLVAIESASATTPGENASLDEYLARPHASFQLSPSQPASIEHDTLLRLGLLQNDRYLVPYFTLLPNLVCSMRNGVAVVPASLAAHYRKILPIRTFRPPIEFPPHNLALVWTKNRARDPALTWLRNTLLGAARRVAERVTDLM